MNSEKQNEHFLSLYFKNEADVRAFVRNGIQNYHDVAEIMQASTIVAWKKFKELDDPEKNFGKWFCVIARYEIMRFRRDKARDRLILDEPLLEKILNEGMSEYDQRKETMEHLKSCIEKLKPSSRQLLEIAYDSETAINDFAKRMNKKANAVYQSLRRIRILVAECMEQKIYKSSNETTGKTF